MINTWVEKSGGGDVQFSKPSFSEMTQRSKTNHYIDCKQGPVVHNHHQKHKEYQLKPTLIETYIMERHANFSLHIYICF